MTVEIQHLCDRVLAVTSPEGFAAALGIALRSVDRTDAVESFAGAFPIGVFTDADLRVNRSSGLMFLVLKVRNDAGVDLDHVKLTRYGIHPVSVENNPRIPPEGTMSYLYDVHGVRIAFQFTALSKLLKVVSFEWPPRP